MNRNLYVDVHVLQTVPASCVNRDDTGSPKTAVYGGTTRARVSSQAWKKAMRDMFRSLFDEKELGLRTKRIPELLAEEINALTPAANALDAAMKALELAGIGLDKKKNTTDALFFISRAQLKALAQLTVDGETDKKKYSAALKAFPSIDNALFGRMVASDPSLNYDAAAQVAHSISTHTVHNEYDYFTAVDDCSPEDNAGAGHLGTVEFNSSTLYRYATVNGNALSENLGADTAKAIRGFLEAFVRSMPTGKQNTFANRTLPDLVYVTIREDQPVNLAGAFEKPVSGKDGYAEESVRRLFAYADTVYTNFAGAPALALCACNYPMTSDGTEKMPLSALLDRVEAYAEQRLADGKGGK